MTTRQRQSQPPAPRSNPFRELQRLDHDLNKLWGGDWGSLMSMTDNNAMDMYEEAGSLITEVSLPNFKKNEIKVTTNEGVLEISADHKEEGERKDKRHYYFHESSNQYFRRVTLPEDVNTDKTEALFKDGILKITMPIDETKKKAKTVTVT